MSKNTHLIGQPLVRQILSLLPRQKVDSIARKLDSDRYYKSFRTFDHAVTMLYAVMSGAKSLRAVVLGLLASEKRIYHLGIRHFPRRSTISDANRNRSSQVFAEIYKALHKQFGKLLTDSRSRTVMDRLKIIDSTTISLFKAILKAVGRHPVNGKRKGGIKVHTQIDSGEDLPQFVCFSASARHDRPFLRKMDFEPGDILVFDKAYNDYAMFLEWTNQEIFFCTRMKDNADYSVVEEFPLSDQCDSRIQSDQQIRLRVPNSENELLLRRIVFCDEENNSKLVFLTNIFFLNPDMIARIYKRRWQIELLFKRLKQNFPLRYFLGDNVNAIEIQIWSCLIADLLYQVILRKTKRKWAYSNFCDLIRQHLFTYTDLPAFLRDPEKILRQQIRAKLQEPESQQLQLFSP